MDVAPGEFKDRILDGLFAFKFARTWADFGCNQYTARKIPGLGLFYPEFLYLIATAYVRTLGFVSLTSLNA